MSRLLSSEAAEGAARLGSFVLYRGQAAFRPKGSAMPDQDNDGGTEAEPDAFALGVEEGRRAAEAELAEEREAVIRLARTLETLRPEPTNALALLLAETVDRLVREIVGEVAVDPTRLLARAKAAAALIGENVEPSKLRAHPDDVATLQAADLQIEIAADPALARGTLVIETGHGWIEDGPAVRLERLRAALDRMAASQ